MKWKHTSPLFPELTDVSGVKQQFQVRGRHGVCVLCLLGSLITPKMPVQLNQVLEVTLSIMHVLYTQWHTAVGLSCC